MIPLSIEKLLEGRVVERNRVEYKEGWNPGDTIHTICAFANDYDNVNGGYVVIGVEEENGLPILPPRGIAKEQLDMIQQELFQYCNLIEPRYIPAVEVVNYPDENTHLIYLKCSPGDAGPYQAPVDVYSKKAAGVKTDKTKKYWIRPGSLTIAAKQSEIAELFEKFNSVPYDDRINRIATLDTIRRGYLEDFLRESKSTLVKELNTRSLEDLLISLEVANETDTDIAIRNIGLLMFAEHPEKFIPGAQIDLVRFNSPLAEASNDFTEKTFTGPIWKQIRDVLDYINTTVIEEKVVKVQGKAESERYFNYPYNALEEVLVNAVFHKSYRDPEPVEVRIYLDYIQIINYPGPDKWIDMEKFALGKIRARKYRNRRIGEFLKEIDLSEKQSTGITKIIYELTQNGSPMVEFETDPERTYLITTINAKEGFVGRTGKTDRSFDRSLTEVLTEVLTEKDFEKIEPMVTYLENHGKIAPKVAEGILHKSKSTVYRYLDKLVKAGVLEPQGNTNDKVYVRKK